MYSTYETSAGNDLMVIFFFVLTVVSCLSVIVNFYYSPVDEVPCSHTCIQYNNVQARYTYSTVQYSISIGDAELSNLS